MIALRNSEPVFDTDEIYIHSDASNGIKVIHLNYSEPNSDEISKIFVIGNFGVSTHTTQIEEENTGTWYDLFNNNKKTTFHC